MALVTLSGRLLARQDGGQFWIDGVNPGGLTVPTRELATASQDVQKALQEVLTDFAVAAQDFEAFKQSAEQFFHDTDQGSIEEWEAAVRAVQAGSAPNPLALPVRPATSPIAINVELIELPKVTPTLNSNVEPLLAAAA